MKKLREVDGDNKESEQQQQDIYLDGKKISESQLNEAKDKKNVRINEIEQGKFETLERLRG